MNWPMPSSPVLTPSCAIYYSRLVGATSQGNCVQVHVHPWQVGVILRELMARYDFLKIDDHRFEYVEALERDLSGAVTRGRSFAARLSGVTIESALEAAKKHPGSVPDIAERQMRALLQARGRVSGALEGSQEAPKDGAAGALPAAVVERPKREKITKEPRPSRDGLTTLASMCEEAGVLARDVRALLRQKKIEKPDAGWAFASDDPRLGDVMDAIKIVKAGG